MDHSMIASRLFDVVPDETAVEEYIVGVGAPYCPAEIGPPEWWGCRVYYGVSNEPVDHEVIGADAFEALENAIEYARFFLLSLSKENTIRAKDGQLLDTAFPSEFSQRFRADLGSVLRRRS